jgi:hypothetical protein
MDVTIQLSDVTSQYISRLVVNGVKSFEDRKLIIMMKEKNYSNTSFGIKLTAFSILLLCQGNKHSLSEIGNADETAVF